MTKISITPNASGTGTFNLTAPNSSANRTFTLPDATGTVYTSGNAVGTVSQSGGVPTGAIIERGSNANGTFTKFADGTMIANIVALENRTASGNLTTNLTLPTTFSDMAHPIANDASNTRPYSAQVSIETSVPDVAKNAVVNNPTTTSLEVIIDRSSGTPSRFQVTIHGRWF
jgi:hypothetical protein